VALHFPGFLAGAESLRVGAGAMTDFEPALLAWELECHTSLATAPQVRRHLRLSVGTRQMPLLTLPSGTQRARCQVGQRTPASLGVVTQLDTRAFTGLP
jgi:hypothetical protein